MKSVSFSKVLRQVPHLNHSQRIRLREELDHSDDLQLVCDIVESRIEDNPFCPHCHSGDFIKHGTRSELIRYKCKNCGRTFNALTGTPLAHLKRKEQWLKYSKCLLDSQTIRKSAAITEVSITTSFTWRHRMLKISQKGEAQLLSGVVEADETFLLESQKGSRKLNRPARKRGGRARKRGLSKELVSILVAFDRNGNEADYVTGFGPLSANWLNEHFVEHLDSDAVLVTDSAKSFKSFCINKRVEHVCVNLSQGIRVKGVFHIQHANAYHRTFKQWLMRFHGVATKYLDHYLGWCNELHNRCIDSPATLLKLAFELKTPQTIT